MFALALVAVLVSRWVVSIARLSIKGIVVSKERTKDSTNVTCYMICKNFYLRKCQSGGELGQLHGNQ